MKRVCIEGGCPELTSETRCAAHKRAYQAARDRRRGSPAQRGYDAEYRRNRVAVLALSRVCSYCGREANTVDHVVPLARGGSNDVENLVPSCLRCNSRRGGMTRRRNGWWVR